MKLKKGIAFLLMIALIAASCPVGVLASNVQQTSSKDTMVVQSLDEVADIDENSNIDQQIIVIYQNNSCKISSLGLTTQEITGSSSYRIGWTSSKSKTRRMWTPWSISYRKIRMY